MARRGRGRGRARHLGAIATQSAGRGAVLSETPEETGATSPPADHRQAAQLPRGLWVSNSQFWLNPGLRRRCVAPVRNLRWRAYELPGSRTSGGPRGAQGTARDRSGRRLTPTRRGRGGLPRLTAPCDRHDRGTRSARAGGVAASAGGSGSGGSVPRHRSVRAQRATAATRRRTSASDSSSGG